MDLMERYVLNFFGKWDNYFGLRNMEYKVFGEN